MPVVTLILLLLLALIALLATMTHSLAAMLLKPPRMTDGKALYVMKRMSPGDLGLAFDRLFFESRDVRTGKPLRIAAWWVPANGSRSTVVIIHGFGDAKVGSLAWAPTWQALGWNVLLVDLRAHGESDGDACTGGFFERDDLDAVLNQHRARRPDASERVALFGISLGGAVAIATAARRSDLAAVIADSVFADYREAASTHGRLIGAPFLRLIPLATRWAERLGDADFDAVRPVDRIPDVAAPLMLIHGEVDAFVGPAEIARLHDAARRRTAQTECVVVPEAGHCLEIVADPEGFSKRIEAFLTRTITSPDAAPSRG